MNLPYETDAEDGMYNSLHCLEWKWTLLLKSQVIHTTHISHGHKPQSRKGFPSTLLLQQSHYQVLQLRRWMTKMTLHVHIVMQS